MSAQIICIYGLQDSILDSHGSINSLKSTCNLYNNPMLNVFNLYRTIHSNLQNILKTYKN